ncbi:MAG: hypothetical protein IKA79_09225, partial [Lentisphaeria bacterium]|nr:hypothetical protein [Lentisphaeria bacterium]
MKNRQTVSWGSLLSFCSSDPGRNGENKTVQEEYGAKGYFGFSALSSGLPVSSIVEIADQEGFSAIELSHDQLENLSVMQRKRILEYFPVIVAGSFVSGSFASGILSCPPEMLDTFAAELENLFRKFAFLNIRY